MPLKRSLFTHAFKEGSACSMGRVLKVSAVLGVPRGGQHEGQDCGVDTSLLPFTLSLPNGQKGESSSLRTFKPSWERFMPFLVKSTSCLKVPHKEENTQDLLTCLGRREDTTMIA